MQYATQYYVQQIGNHLNHGGQIKVKFYFRAPEGNVHVTYTLTEKGVLAPLLKNVSVGYFSWPAGSWAEYYFPIAPVYHNLHLNKGEYYISFFLNRKLIVTTNFFVDKPIVVTWAV